MLEVFTVTLTGIDHLESGASGSKTLLGLDPDYPGRAGDRLDPRAVRRLSFKGAWRFDGTTGEWLTEPNLAAGEREIERACAPAESRGLVAVCGPDG